MGCCQYHALVSEEGESAFTVDAPIVTFGPGSLREVGPRARSLGMSRVAIYTDPMVADLPMLRTVLNSLAQEGLDVAVYDECLVEPSDESFAEGARFARDGAFDGYISLGGGSVIDSCKVANLLASHPLERDTLSDEILGYINAPIGDAVPVEGSIAPHIACPTTAGTGSEATGIAICDVVSLDVKTGIASAHIRPSQAVVDPDCTAHLPRMVAACCAFDVLCHALESYTARPYTSRDRVADPAHRPASQGANPWSDMGCREALRLLGKYMIRGVNDASDEDARAELMWAATLAGIAFGNCGVHVPHGMSYAVAGQIEECTIEGYPTNKPLVPHGMSVVVSAPAVFRYTAESAPQRHLRAAGLLGADIKEATLEDAGDVLSSRLAELMKSCGMPDGIGALGFDESHLDNLVEGTYAQQRLLVNAPMDMPRSALRALFRDSMSVY